MMPWKSGIILSLLVVTIFISVEDLAGATATTVTATGRGASSLVLLVMRREMVSSSSSSLLVVVVVAAAAAVVVPSPSTSFSCSSRIFCSFDVSVAALSLSIPILLVP